MAVTWRAESSLSTGWAELRNRDRGMSPEHPQSVGFSVASDLGGSGEIAKSTERQTSTARSDSELPLHSR